MKNQVEKNYIYNLIYQFVVILTPLIITPYTARILEVDGVGLNSGINSICSTFLLFALLGTTTYSVKYIGSVQEDIKTRSIRFWEIQIFRTITTSLTFIGYIFFVNYTESNWIQYYMIYSILIANVIADITWFFQGLEKFRIIVIRNVLVRIAFIILVFILVKTKNDLALYMMLSCITTLLGSVLMWASLPKFIEKIKLSDLHPFANTKGIIILFLPTIAIQIYTVLDKTLLMAFATNTVENGYYEQSEKIVKMSMTVITSLSTVLMPRISNLYENNRLDEVKKYMKTTYRIVWMLGTPLLCGLCAIASTLIPLFLGSGYEKSVELIYLLSPLVLIIGFSNTIAMQFLVPSGNEKTFTIASIIAAVSNLIIDLILIPKLYSVGASLGTIFAEFIGLVYIICFVIKKKYFKLSDFFEGSLKYLIASVIMTVFVLAVKYLLPINLFGIFCSIFVGIIIYFLCLLILKDSILIQLFGRLRRNR